MDDTDEEPVASQFIINNCQSLPLTIMLKTVASQDLWIWRESQGLITTSIY